MKILMVNSSVMVHLEPDEARAVNEAMRTYLRPDVDIIERNDGDKALVAEIVRQIDICLKHKQPGGGEK